MPWEGHPGSGSVRIDGTITLVSTANLEVGSASHAGSGVQVVALGNALTIPASLAALTGGVLYASSGHLVWLGDGGTLTQIASR